MSRKVAVKVNPKYFPDGRFTKGKMYVAEVDGFGYWIIDDNDEKTFVHNECCQSIKKLGKKKNLMR